MHRLAIVISVICVFASGIFGQDASESAPKLDLANLEIQQGSHRELRGITKIHLLPTLSKERNEEMLAVLRDSKLKFEIVASAADAEVILAFSVTGSQHTSSVSQPQTSPSTSRIPYDYMRYKGRGIAYKILAPQRIRILFDFDKRRGDRYSFRPWKSFVEDFLEKLEAANKL